MKSMPMAGGMILLFLLTLIANVHAETGVYGKAHIILSKLNRAFGLTVGDDGAVMLSQIYSFRYKRQLWAPKKDSQTNLTYLVNVHYDAGLIAENGEVSAVENSKGDYWQLHATNQKFADVRHNSTAKELTVENADKLEGSFVIMERWQGKKEQLWSLATLPPLSQSPKYGAHDHGSLKYGFVYDHGAHAALTEINVRYDGNVVHQLNVTYINKEGVPYNPPPNGNNGGSQVEKIQINITEEHLHKICGTYAFVLHRSRTGEICLNAKGRGHTAITSISFHIKNNHNGEVTEFGPYGTRVGSSFESPHGEIVGLHGRSGGWLDSIGTWYYPETWHTVDDDLKSEAKPFFA